MDEAICEWNHIKGTKINMIGQHSPHKYTVISSIDAQIFDQQALC